MALTDEERAREQLTREPRQFPELAVITQRGGITGQGMPPLPPPIQNVWEYDWNDLLLFDYDPHPAIKAKVAV